MGNLSRLCWTPCSDGVTRAAPLCGNFRANFPDTLTDKPQTSVAVAVAQPVSTVSEYFPPLRMGSQPAQPAQLCCSRAQGKQEKSHELHTSVEIHVMRPIFTNIFSDVFQKGSQVQNP